MEFFFCVHVTLVKKLKHVQLPTIQHLSADFPLEVDYCGFEGNFSQTVGLISIKFVTDIHFLPR